MKITEEDFLLWKDHNITKKVFKWLEYTKKDVNEELMDESLYSTDGLLRLKYLCGERSIIDDILRLTEEDFIDED